MAVDRSALDEAITNIAVKSSPFNKEYQFYLHMISQCRIVFTESMPAAAGVAFHKDHYTLYLNPSEVIGTSIDEKGNEEEILGFTSRMPLEQRIGILKHEMLHITLGHILRVEDRDFRKFNIASDCALDQEIQRDHLPSYAIYPDNIPTSVKDVKLRENAEYYYEIIDDSKTECKKGEEEGQNFGKGVGDHGVWQESEGDEELQKELTKNMVEKAGEQTIKSRGTLPSNYDQIIENLTIRREVDWKQVLRRIVGNKKANTRKTLMRRDRRLPFANWIKGKTKDRVFNLGVVSDVSGSVADKALYDLWGEIINICDLFKVPVSMIQIDTQPTTPETLTRSVKAIARKACGGTVLAPAIAKFKEHGIAFDALVVTTDGFLCSTDVQAFQDIGKPVIWLIESDGVIMDEMNYGKMRAIKLKSDK